jgi:hypothetical protein
MQKGTKIAIALASIVLAGLVCTCGFWLVIIAPLRLGLIPIPDTNAGTAARWALNVFPLIAIATTVIIGLLLSIRFYRKFSKKFLRDRVPN